MKIEYESIGMIRTPFEQRSGMPRNPGESIGTQGRVEVQADVAAGLRDLDGFSHVILLFHFHQSSGHALELVPRGRKAKRGVFATRAPRRPNAIGLSVVRLDRVAGNVLHVRDVDMVDRTPLLDIKPYLPSIDAHATATMGWLAHAPGDDGGADHSGATGQGPSSRAGTDP